MTEYFVTIMNAAEVTSVFGEISIHVEVLTQLFFSFVNAGKTHMDVFDTLISKPIR